MAPVIIVHGPPNSGKSTQAKLLAQDRGYTRLSSGDELRNTKDPVILERIQTGALAKSEDILRLMRAAIEKVPSDQTIVLDGFPRMINEYQEVREWFKQMDRPLKAVVEIGLSEEESHRRSLGRNRHDDMNSEERWKWYRAETQKVLDDAKAEGLLRSVDGEASIQEVTKRLEAAL